MAHLFGFPLAFLGVMGVYMHELGHIAAYESFGYKTRGIYMLPFLGGVAIAKEEISSDAENVAVSLAGPFAGLTFSLICLVAGHFTGSNALEIVALASAAINAFNLLPFLPMDGGWVYTSIVFSLKNTLARNALFALTACIPLATIIIAPSVALFFTLGAVAEFARRQQDRDLPSMKFAHRKNIWETALTAWRADNGADDEPGKEWDELRPGQAVGFRALEGKEILIAVVAYVSVVACCIGAAAMALEALRAKSALPGNREGLNAALGGFERAMSGWVEIVAFALSWLLCAVQAIRAWHTVKLRVPYEVATDYFERLETFARLLDESGEDGPRSKIVRSAKRAYNPFAHKEIPPESILEPLDVVMVREPRMPH